MYSDPYLAKFNINLTLYIKNNVGIDLICICENPNSAAKFVMQSSASSVFSSHKVDSGLFMAKTNEHAETTKPFKLGLKMFKLSAFLE